MTDNPQNQDKPKIVVDEDWKNQAQKEKEKLADETGGAGPAPAGGRRLPPASFSTLVSGIVTQILFALGAIQDPQTGRRYLDIELAKHHIDTLTLLEEKTKNNLAPEEKKLLDNALYEVRMAYVRAAQGGRG